MTPFDTNNGRISQEMQHTTDRVNTSPPTLAPTMMPTGSSALGDDDVLGVNVAVTLREGV